MPNVDGPAKDQHISIIVAIGKNNVIGKKDELLWPIPDDLKRFKSLTMGHPVVMGRKTFESIMNSLGKPLPGRTNIVVTRDAEYPAPEGVLLAQTFPEALSRAKDSEGAEEIFIIGGGQIYEASLPFADRLYLTLIDAAEDGDTFFPAYESQFTRETFHENREWEGLKYVWSTLER